MPLSEIDKWILMQDDASLGSEQLERKRKLEKELGIHSSVEEMLKDVGKNNNKKKGA